MDDRSGLPRIAIQRSRDVLVATIQIDLTEPVLARFQEDLLTRIHATHARGVVLDLSGSDTLDLHEFEALRRVVAMAELMGARAVFVGLGPGVVSALITLGADTDGVRATLDLDEALRMLGSDEGEVEPDELPAAQEATEAPAPQPGELPR